MAFFHSPQLVTSGLVTALDVANSKSYPGSGTTLYDLAGRANANLYNTSFSSAYKGGLICNGSGTTIAVTDVTATNYFTTCLFFMYNGNGPSGESILFNKEDCWEMRDDNGNINWAVYASNQSWFWYDTGIDISSGVPTFIALSYDGSAVRTYKNGVLGSTYNYPTGGVLANQTAAYPKFNSRGYNLGAGNYPGNNTLYNWTIYNRALTNDEISQNYNALKTRFGL